MSCQIVVASFDSRGFLVSSVRMSVDDLGFPVKMLHAAQNIRDGYWVAKMKKISRLIFRGGLA